MKRKLVGALLVAGFAVLAVPSSAFANFNLTGTVYEDLNGNGSKAGGSGEPGTVGVRLYLDGSNGRPANDQFDPADVANGLPAETTVNSGADGAYSFTNLVGPGTYTVREDLSTAPAGSQCLTPSTNPAACEYTVTSTTQNQTNNNFGNFRPITVSGTEFVDTNANGIQDGGETALGGVVIYQDLNHSNDLTAGEPTGTSDGSGNWSLSARPGTSEIREVVPTGYQCSTPGTNTINDSTTCEFSHTLISGQSAVTGDKFGNYQPVSISGSKFHDLNANGNDDSGTDPALSGIIIYLDLNNNGSRGTGGSAEPFATTNANGLWSFTGLKPGTYHVREDLANSPSSGYECSTPGTIGTPSTCEFNLALASGATSTANKFGNFKRVSISGTKFVDNNSNGTKDQGESGLGNVRIYLDTGNDVFDSGSETSVLTAGNGTYSFINLLPGSYTVREVPPATAPICSTPGTITNDDPDADCEYSHTFTSGQSSSTDNFGDFKRASISGLKFNDLNGNGVQDANADPNLDEKPIEGVTIYLDGSNGRPANDQFDAADPALSLPAETSTTTDANGNYSFTNLNPGNYSVREVPPDGTSCTFPGGTDATCEYNFTPLGSGIDSTGNNFGNAAPGSITGTKFEDLNANGTKDGSDSGLGGVIIYVDANNNNALDPGEAQTTTAADGTWTLTDIPAGTRTVREVEPTNYTCTAPGTTGDFSSCEFSVPVISGQTATGGYDFGNAPLPKISGTKFEDLNANQVWDDTGANPEPPLGGVTIYLDLNDNNVLDTGQNGEPSTTTDDVTGKYSFSVAPGNGPTDPDGDGYTVREKLTGGYECSYPGTIGDFDSCEHSVKDLTLGGADSTGNNFGNFKPVSIAGTKFHDMNANGIKQGGDAGLPGWTIYLDGSNGRPANDQFDPADVANNLPAETSTMTDASGNYSFTGLLPGDYTVREDPQANWHCSTPGTIGNEGPDTDCEYNLSLASGTNATGKDFGNFQYASVSGTKFDDQNFNGAKDISEPGIDGVTIYLDGSNGRPANNQFDPADVANNLPAETSTMTSGGGNWSFTGLVPGSYTEREIEPAGYLCSAPSTNFVNCEFGQTLTSGAADNTGQDFGNVQSATFAGTKFDDANGNGVNDGEGPVSGVQIYLDGTGGQLADDIYESGEATTTTDGTGAWSIGDLYPGTYTAREVEPSGHQCSAPSSTFANCEFTEALSPGESDSTGQDFGNFPGFDLAITKTDSADPVNTGAALTYTITVTNNGAGTATGVTVTDTLPAGTTFVSASAGCNNTAGTVTCTIGSINAGAQAVVTIDVTAPSSAGTISNTASVQGAQFDAVPGNDSATESTTVNTPGGGGGGGGGGGTGGGGTGGGGTPGGTTGGTGGTITGTASSDQLTGTPGNDVIMGGAGNDVINCGGGKDTVFAGGGNDVVNCGGGNDIVYGGPGSDLLRGQAGNDTLKGQGGKDKLLGAAGNDTLVGGPGTDILKPGSGKNKIKQ
jgi:uncharacterized repeat protein (TIGR01451 family)